MNTNAPATRAAGGSLAVQSLKGLKTAMQNVQQTAHINGGDTLLKFGKDGKWVFGQENLEVEPHARWAANIFNMKWGYICWKVIPEGSKEKPELLGEVLVSYFEPLPDKASLPDYGHPWAECHAVDLKCLDGEDKDTQVLFKTSSTGGLRAMKDLREAILAIPDDSTTPIPVMLLRGDSYIHSTWGKTYFPILEIVEWAPFGDQPDEADAPEPEPEKAPAPAATTRRRAAAAPEPANDQKAAEPEPEQATAPAGEGERRRRRRG